VDGNVEIIVLVTVCRFDVGVPKCSNSLSPKYTVLYRTMQNVMVNVP
jgi:hypothetical protein